MAEKKTTTKRRLATSSAKETISSEISDEASTAPSFMSLNSRDVVVNFKDGQSPRPQISDEVSIAPSFMSLWSKGHVVDFKLGQSPRDQMGSRILLLLILTSSVWAGTFELNQTQSLYEAVENQTITLEWTFTTRRPLRYYEVYCEHITDVRISVVLHVENGVQNPDSQNPDLTGRVQFDEESFREGRLRVHVSRLQTTDSGLYRCVMKTEYGGSVGKCRLSVSAAANETQTLRPGPEIRGRTGLYVVLGLTVAGHWSLQLQQEGNIRGVEGRSSLQRSRHVE